MATKPLDPAVKTLNAAQKVLDSVNKRIESNKIAAKVLAEEKATAVANVKTAKEAVKATTKK